MSDTQTNRTTLSQEWKSIPLKFAVQDAQTGIWGNDANGGDDDVLCARVADFDRAKSEVVKVPTIRRISSQDREKCALQRGDLLVEKSGGTEKNPVGTVVSYQGPLPAVFANFIFRLRMTTEHDSRFWLYALSCSHETGRTRNYVRQTTGIQNLDVDGYMSMKHDAPNLKHQIEIADYLDRETGEIDAMLAKMDELTQQLLERLSVVQTREVFGLAAGGLEQEPTFHSLLTGIPDHWKRTKFGYDFTESRERNGESPVGKLLSISEYRGVEPNRRTKGQKASSDVSNYRVVRPNQLAANMMWLNHGGLGVSSHTGYISPDYKAFFISPRFEPRYVHHLFRSSRFVDYFSVISTGVRPNAQRVTMTILNAAPVPLPPLAEQQRIADHLDEVTARIDTMLAKVAELKALLVERRAALISDVVTGRKDIS